MASPSQVGSSAISAVHWVIARTKTRSKKSSSGVTSPRSRSVAAIWGRWMRGVVGIVVDTVYRIGVSAETSSASRATIATSSAPEEPGDVEVEPVLEDELDADDQRGGERGDLDQGPPPRDERDGDPEDDDADLERASAATRGRSAPRC